MVNSKLTILQITYLTQMVAGICNSSIPEADAGGLQVQGQGGLNHEILT